jgi:hypothetical protein
MTSASAKERRTGQFVASCGVMSRHVIAVTPSPLTGPNPREVENSP